MRFPLADPDAFSQSHKQQMVITALPWSASAARLSRFISPPSAAHVWAASRQSSALLLRRQPCRLLILGDMQQASHLKLPIGSKSSAVSLLGP
jgi:hypothetical protein